MPEPQLVAAALAGDQDAFRDLWRPVERTAYGVCLHLTGNRTDALDALQETQIAAWRHLARFEGRATFAGWVLAIARNAARDLLRRRGTARELGLDAAGERPDDQPLFADVVSDVLGLRAALATLPINHREALLLWAGGLTYEEVAAVEQVPVNTIKVWIYRARQRLRRELAE
ncbi:RNA polymerase sigma factor [Dactylosporangium sp. AC04546]|uniref:RNA polymerase sigma factor n=1 Tax=Dactylosporangium sp. AC04546 TaxID=2862460 RepID=UPI001EE1007A|nr:RNA polymerase sigma factor [Dactylosporangium sp. AC04546]WVK87102.1 RNA polymerase sigma factor [Dactylosporangium sp. AC04546]